MRGVLSFRLGIAGIAAAGVLTVVALVAAAPAAQAQTAVAAQPAFTPVGNFNPPPGSALPDATVGASYSTTITSSGDPAPTFSAQGLPPGLAIGSTSGVISGTPTTAGTYTVTVVAENESATMGSAAEGSYTLTVNPPANKADLSVQVTGPAAVAPGSAVSYTVTVTNNGPATATGVTTVAAVAGLGSVSSTPSAPEGTLRGFTGLLFKDPSLAAGSSVTYTVSGTVTARAGGHIGATAVTASAVPDPKLANNLSAVSEPVG